MGLRRARVVDRRFSHVRGRVEHPGELFLHSRLWEDPVPGNRVPFVPVDHDPPVDKLSDDYLTVESNTATVAAAYRTLKRRGLVSAKAWRADTGPCRKAA